MLSSDVGLLQDGQWYQLRLRSLTLYEMNRSGTVKEITDTGHARNGGLLAR